MPFSLLILAVHVAKWSHALLREDLQSWQHGLGQIFIALVPWERYYLPGWVVDNAATSTEPIIELKYSQ